MALTPAIPSARGAGALEKSGGKGWRGRRGYLLAPARGSSARRIRPARRVRRYAIVMSMDLGPLLEGFPYTEGQVSARRIVGLDGREKIQVRIEHGLLQLEADNHPGGQRPFECESLLDYHVERLDAIRRVAGNDGGFVLSPSDCEALRAEGVLYYLRYVCCLELRDFGRAIRDTERNLRALDLCRRYAERDEDREALEQYRPYILMMRARARAGQMVELGEPDKAAELIADAMKEIRLIVLERGGDDPSETERELAAFEALLTESGAGSAGMVDTLGLRLELQDAIEREDYRRAAALRDEIRRQEREGA